MEIKLISTDIWWRKIWSIYDSKISIFNLVNMKYLENDKPYPSFFNSIWHYLIDQHSINMSYWKFSEDENNRILFPKKYSMYFHILNRLDLLNNRELQEKIQLLFLILYKDGLIFSKKNQGLRCERCNYRISFQGNNKFCKYCNIKLFVQNNTEWILDSQRLQRDISNNLKIEANSPNPIISTNEPWMISIPVLNCSECGEMPIPECNLPFNKVHPTNNEFIHSESPKESFKYYHVTITKCPYCNEAATPVSEAISLEFIVFCIYIFNDLIINNNCTKTQTINYNLYSSDNDQEENILKHFKFLSNLVVRNYFPEGTLG